MSANKVLAIVLTVLLSAWVMVTLNRQHAPPPPAQPAPVNPSPKTPPDSRPRRPTPRGPT